MEPGLGAAFASNPTAHVPGFPSTHLAASAQRFPLFHMPFILPLNAEANPDFVGPESVQLRKKTAKIYYFVKFYKNILECEHICKDPPRTLGTLVK